MALDKLKEQITQDLVNVSTALTDTKTSAAHWNKMVIELETEHRALQAALDVLEGKGSAPTSGPQSLGPSVFSSSTSISQGTQVTLNGEPIILEPGFKIEKDADGYERLVPESILVSQVKFTPTSKIVPPPISDFSEPEKLI